VAASFLAGPVSLLPNFYEDSLCPKKEAKRFPRGLKSNGSKRSYQREPLDPEVNGKSKKTKTKHVGALLEQRTLRCTRAGSVDLRV
jgi:hypothetical protein